MKNEDTSPEQTSIELPIETLQSGTQLSPLTEAGTEAFARTVRTILPFLPAIVVSGQWAEWTEGHVAAAIEAVITTARQLAQKNATPQDEYLVNDPDMIQTEQLDAHYVTGVVVGMVLADALRGARRPQ